MYVMHVVMYAVMCVVMYVVMHVVMYVVMHVVMHVVMYVVMYKHDTYSSHVSVCNRLHSNRHEGTHVYWYMQSECRCLLYTYI